MIMIFMAYVVLFFSAYFDMEKWTMDIYLNNPTTDPRPLYTFNIPPSPAAVDEI